MRRLILFRHARTERRAPSGDDFDRRLTAEGTLEAAEMGRRLKASGYVPGVVLLSPAVRARETWEAARAAMPHVPVEEKPALYACSPEDVLRLANGRGEELVMVVGHNPTLHDLAAALLETADGRFPGGARLDGFPTASIAVYDLGGARPRPLAALLFSDGPPGGAA
jgi:phosphohistidine phosphatase